MAVKRYILCPMSMPYIFSIFSESSNATFEFIHEQREFSSFFDVPTYIVQVKRNEAMQKLCCVSGALRGADDCTVSCTNMESESMRFTNCI